jgi:outer membrane receptor protein involved in Fe transport
LPHRPCGWIPHDTWRLPLCVAIAVLLASPAPAGAAEDSLDTVVITATRLARDAHDTPASIDRVAIRRDGFGVNVADSLTAVPGLVARDRQNCQDTQISVRGFGARSPFGIRGVRLYIDGIQPRSLMDKGRFRTSIWRPQGASKCCAVRSRRNTAIHRVA